MNDEYTHLINDNLNRIANAIEEVLRLVKEDQERSRKYMEEKKDEQETRLGEYPGPPEPLAMAQGPRPKLQGPGCKLQASSSKLDKTTLQRYSIL